MTRTVEITVCDVCGVNESGKWRACLRCKRLVCRECQGNGHVAEFQQSVYSSSDLDGRYCTGCVTELTVAPDALFLAYAKITELIAERLAVRADFEARAAAAEQDIIRLREELDK